MKSTVPTCRAYGGSCNCSNSDTITCPHPDDVAAPVASAAPSGEREKFEAAMRAKFAPMDAGDLRWDGEKFTSKFTQLAFDMWNARAAIAHQPPKEALTDAQIKELSLDVFMRYSSDNEDYTFDVLRKFARAIEAATAPNKQLVAALHELALLMSDTIRGEYEPDSFTLQPAVHALAEVGIEFPDDDYLLTKRESCTVVPVEPTAAMIKAMAESRAVDDEGEYPLMLDLLDFSGENKTDTALRAAYAAALDAAGEVQS